MKDRDRSARIVCEARSEWYREKRGQFEDLLQAKEFENLLLRERVDNLEKEMGTKKILIMELGNREKAILKEMKLMDETNDLCRRQKEKIVILEEGIIKLRDEKTCLTELVSRHEKDTQKYKKEIMKKDKKIKELYELTRKSIKNGNFHKQKEVSGQNSSGNSVENRLKLIIENKNRTIEGLESELALRDKETRSSKDYVVSVRDNDEMRKRHEELRIRYTDLEKRCWELEEKLSEKDKIIEGLGDSLYLYQRNVPVPDGKNDDPDNMGLKTAAGSKVGDCGYIPAAQLDSCGYGFIPDEKIGLLEKNRAASGIDIVLYASDEKLRDVMRKGLCSAGYNIIEISDRKDVVSAVREYMPSLIVYDFISSEDIGMLNTLKQYPLIISSWEDIDVLIQEKGIRAEIIHDPYRSDILLAKVKELMSRSGSIGLQADSLLEV